LHNDSPFTHTERDRFEISWHLLATHVPVPFLTNWA
jgi:hypothetical protein